MLLWKINDSFAETGVSKGVFKVVVSIYGIEDKTGDITAIVTLDGHSRVKTFYLNRENRTNNNSSSLNVLRFTAAFPNVVSKSGDNYKACVIKLVDMRQYCNEGKISPKKGAVFIGISLDKNIKVPDTKVENIIKNNGNNGLREAENTIIEEPKNVLPNYSINK